MGDHIRIPSAEDLLFFASLFRFHFLSLCCVDNCIGFDVISVFSLFFLLFFVASLVSMTKDSFNFGLAIHSALLLCFFRVCCEGEKKM